MGIRRFALAAAVFLLALAMIGIDRRVEALPPAGVDTLPLVITADITSRLGDEQVVLTGTAEITRDDPHLDGGVEVSDFRITDMNLVGASQVGAITALPPSTIGPMGAVSHSADAGGDGDGFQLNAAAAFTNDLFASTGVAAQDYDSGTSAATTCTDAGKDRHRFWGFEAELPPVASIAGIEVMVDAWTDQGAGTRIMCVELSWDGGATWTAPKSTAQLGTTVSTRLLGGASDTWGREWTPGELSKNNLRVRITNVAPDYVSSASEDNAGANTCSDGQDNRIDQADIINGRVDVNEDGAIGASDDLANVLLDLAAGGTDQVDISDGRVDVNEDGMFNSADDLADVLLDLGSGTQQVDIIDGDIDVDESGAVDAADDLVDVGLFAPDGGDASDPDCQPDFFLDFVGLNVYYSAPSPGEIRANAGQDFPASSFVDLYTAVQAPITFPGGSSIIMHNNEPLHLTPRSGGQKVDLDAWPPLGVTYGLDPVNGVDNDGDTVVDEDGPDEDGDGLHDEDRPGLDPDTPGSGGECFGVSGGPDCDQSEGEDPPANWCVQTSSPLCDDDADGEVDEDPSCIPMYNPGNHNTMKLGVCLEDLTLQFAPELPSFSVAPDGPSGLHPADILGMTPGTGGGGGGGTPLSLVACNDDLGLGTLLSEVTFSATAGTTYRIQVGSWSTSAGGNLDLRAYVGAPGSPAPVAVSGNDNLAGAHAISTLPYRATQNTVTATTEPNEPLNVPCPVGGRTVWYRYTAPSSASVTVTTSPDSNFDTVLAVYTGDSYVAGGGGGDTTPPIVRIPCVNLGLTTDGCDTGVDGDQDDLDALSYGDDVFTGTENRLNFSVGPGSQGAPGTAVRTQADCPSPEPEPDEFSSGLDGANALVMDGNGPVGACTSAFPFGFVESASERDNLDALHDKDPTSVDPDLNGVPDSPVYFSLASGSPSLGALGASAASILRTVNGATPTVYASPAALGLQTGDDLDALCLLESGDGVFNLGADQIVFSLAPGSPSLATLGAGPADLLVPGSPASILEGGTADKFGLLATDNLDAIKCLSSFMKDPSGDTDGDTIVNEEDPDDDNDGCLDAQELGSNVSLGGRRNPHNFWDFFDTPTAGTNSRDKAVAVTDIVRVVRRFGTHDQGGAAPINRNTDPLSITPMTGYHPAYDRTSLGPNNWNLGPPDGIVATPDILLSVFQFGHSCV